MNAQMAQRQRRVLQRVARAPVRTSIDLEHRAGDAAGIERGPRDAAVPDEAAQRHNQPLAREDESSCGSIPPGCQRARSAPVRGSRTAAAASKLTGSNWLVTIVSAVGRDRRMSGEAAVARREARERRRIARIEDRAVKPRPASHHQHTPVRQRVPAHARARGSANSVNPFSLHNAPPSRAPSFAALTRRGKVCEARTGENRNAAESASGDVSDHSALCPSWPPLWRPSINSVDSVISDGRDKPGHDDPAINGRFNRHRDC